MSSYLIVDVNVTQQVQRYSRGVVTLNFPSDSYLIVDVNVIQQVQTLFERCGDVELFQRFVQRYSRGVVSLNFSGDSYLIADVNVIQQVQTYSRVMVTLTRRGLHRVEGVLVEADGSVRSIDVAAMERRI